jgi:oligoribonuclease
MSKIVWIDLETGGVNDDRIKIENPILMPNGKKIEHIAGSQYYPILEIGIIITDNDLNVLDQYQSEIKNTKQSINKMNQWCIDQHNKTGLTQRSLNSNKTIEQVESECIDFLAKQGLPKRVPMAGSSIHFDHEFITHQMSALSSKFSHQHIDVTSLHNLYKNKHPKIAEQVIDLKSNVTHLVIDDIKDSIQIAKLYSSLIKKEEYTVEELLTNKIKKIKP